MLLKLIFLKGKMILIALKFQIHSCFHILQARGAKSHREPPQSETHSIQPGDFVAISHPQWKPLIGEVKEVHEKTFTVLWWSGTYSGKWKVSTKCTFHQFTIIFCIMCLYLHSLFNMHFLAILITAVSTFQTAPVILTKFWLNNNFTQKS